jgi:hypothetical protein
MPFRGFVDLWQRIHTGVYSRAPDLVLSGTFLPLLLIVALVLALYLLWTRPSVLAVAAVAYALIAVSLNYAAIWQHVGNGERGTYEVFVMLIALFVSIGGVAAQRSRWLLQGFMACALLYLWFASVDATRIRHLVLSSLS